MTAADLAGELAARVGDDVVRVPDRSSLERHTRDYGVQGDPDIGVLAIALPRSTAEVSAVLRWCNERRVAVVPQGGLTGLAGGAVPVGPSLCLSMERMRRIIELDRAAATLTVEAGVALETVQQAAAAADLFFPLDLGGRGSCQIGGNVSTNAGGNRVLRFGMARDLVLGLEAVLADGTVIDCLGKVLKNNAGYDLRQLFIGAEGTLGVVTQVVLRLYPKARSVCTGLMATSGYPAVLELLRRARAGFASQLTAFEVMWPDFYELGTVGLGRRLPLALGHGAYVLIETMGTDPVADPQRYETVIGEAMQAGIVADAVIAQSQRETAALWEVRDSPGEWSQGGYRPRLNFDVSVPTGEIGALADDIGRLLQSRWPGLGVVFFGHVADGNLHVSVRMSGDEVPESDIEREVYALIAQRRGSISAEHGIGSLKIPFLHHTRGPAEIALMRTIKRALDPNGILNPGKIL
jgi:FAD/FMN-containing dehydrogenase